MNTWWQDRVVAVTGAGGFIGSHLCEGLLREGAAVCALVRYNSRSDEGWLADLPASLRKRLTVVQGDVRDEAQMRQFLEPVTVVFHLAALIGIPYSYQAPASYLATNAQGTLNILEAARRNRLERVIVTSTSEVYGTAQHTPMDETHPLEAQSPYAASKIAADMLAVSYARSFNLPLTLVRPFNTFGPRQSLRAVLPTIITQALAGKEIVLGDTTPVRDLNFVANTVAGFLAAAQAERQDGQVFNLASGEGRSIAQVVTEIGEILDRPLRVVKDRQRIRPSRSEVRLLIGDATRAREDLGWKPRVSFRDGLVRTIEWFRKRGQGPKTAKAYHQ